MTFKKDLKKLITFENIKFKNREKAITKRSNNLLKIHIVNYPLCLFKNYVCSINAFTL